MLVLAAAPLGEPLEDRGGRREEARRLQHRQHAAIRGSHRLAVLALVPDDLPYPGVRRQRPDELQVPGTGRGRVLVEEVPPGVKLEAVNLQRELQQDHAFGLPPPELLWAHPLGAQVVEEEAECLATEGDIDLDQL